MELNNNEKVSNQKQKHILIENCEEEFGPWLNLEYSHIIFILEGLYKQSNIDYNLIFTSFNFPNNETKDKERLDNFIQKAELFSKDTKLTLTNENLSTVLKNDFKFENTIINKGTITNFVSEENKPSLKKKICLLDMRGEKTLSPADLNDFDFFLFGGILGDHPPRDRTKQLRDQGYEIRNLGEIQLSTDTAIYYVKEILDGENFKDIKYLQDPEFPLKITFDPSNILLNNLFKLTAFEFLKHVIDNKTLYKNSLKEDFIVNIENLNKNLDSLSKENTNEINQAIKKINLNSSFINNFNFLCNHYNNLKDITLDEIINNSNDFIEANQMEGFRYILNNSFYSVKYKNRKIINFPLICPGMIELWSESNEDLVLFK